MHLSISSLFQQIIGITKAQKQNHQSDVDLIYNEGLSIIFRIGDIEKESCKV